jgi:uncharacterized protein YneF (UPF0154 family)
MLMNLDIKTLITIITFAAAMGGFYYSTQLRLDHLEENIQTLQKQVKIVKRQIGKKLKPVK